jgi:tRNA A-37 threonylcarbamoyl transferase component Bud32/tetratricopeptide (TPR) repeat protein
MSNGNRLERALAIHLQHTVHGGDFDALVREHPDVADLLRAFRDEPDPARDTAPGGIGEPSDSVLGDYRLEIELGRGGSGTVYSAIDQRLGRRVAIKHLHAEVAQRPTTVARFLREAQLLARLEHPGVVKVLDVGNHEGRPWLAMELVSGESLADRIGRLQRNRGHVGDSLRELVTAVAQVADALGHAHRAGIVHRDVKPSNVLLRSDGTAVLTDFGIARDATDPALTQTGVVVGSPHYMAPEQTVGDSAQHGPAVDVFALGATLYECIVLQRAFDGTSAQAVVQAVLHREPPDLRRLQPGLPQDLVAIVQKALEKDPSHRYATADHFAADLRAFLELREVSARTTTRLTRWLRRARREPTVGLAAGLATAVVLLLVWLWLQWPSLSAAKEAERLRAYEAATAAGFDRRSSGLPHFLRAIELAPERPEAVVGLVILKHEHSGVEAALAELDRRIGAAPEPTLLRCRAWLLREAGRSEQAAAIESRLPAARTSIDLWLRAVCLMATPPTPEPVRIEALATASLAVRTAPQANLPLQVYWSRLANLTGNKEQRLEAAESLLAQWPDDAVALQVAGEAIMPYDAPRAIGILQRALERGAVDPRCEVSLGFAHAIAKDVPACVATLERAFAREDLEPAPRGSIMLMLEQLQALELANRLAATWVERNPDVPEARRFAGRAAQRSGDLRTALVHLDRAVELRPNDLDLRLDRTVVYDQLSESNRVREELLLLATRHPQHVDTHRNLVKILRRDGPREALLAELRRWTTVKPEDVDNWRELARERLADGGPEALAEALSAAERADYVAQGNDAATLELRATAIERSGDPAGAAHLRRRAAALPQPR